MILEKTLISTTSQDPQILQLLNDLQGNILKSHGRNNVSLLFLNFSGPPDLIKAWLGNKVSPLITSMKAQLDHSARRKLAADKQLFDNSDPGFIGFSLSASGYRKLGISAPSASRLDSDAKMRFDPEISEWEQPYQSIPDAIIILGISHLDQLTDFENRTVEAISDSAINISHRERGKALLSDDGKHIEHFGYVDGVSQPRYFKEDLESKAPSRVNFDPTAALDLVLVKDPNGKAFSGTSDNVSTNLSGSHGFGSLLAFRKLEQDVSGWNDAVVATGNELNPSSPDFNLIGAQAVGRFKDGTPVVESASPDSPDKVPNDFNYTETDSASKCPFHAHIRKTNPRGKGSSERGRRITRRGIPYGEPSDNEKGLLFMSYQADFSRQLEFMQESWSDNPNFSSGGAGLDSVTGQLGSRPGLAEPSFFNEHGKTDSEKKLSFGQFVTLKGAAYFFTPSMSFLKSLDTDTDLGTDEEDEPIAFGLSVEAIIAVVVALLALIFFIN